MTGLEPKAIAGAGAAVAKAVAKAAEEDPKDRDALRQLAEKAGDLEPSAQLYAKRMLVKQHLRLKLWQPVGRMIGFSREFFENEFEDEMADRLKDVPEDDLVTPKGSVAGPTIQGLGFVVEEPELRAMYLNLLATASDRRVEKSAHPSFAEIIRQLTGEEGRLLASILNGVNHPIVEIRLKAGTVENPDSPGFILQATNVMDWRRNGQAIAAPEHLDFAMYVDNWVRLRLVQVEYELRSLTAAEQYSWVDSHPLVVAARADYDTVEYPRVEIQRGVLTVTSIGRMFEKAVIREPVAQQ